MLLNCGVGGDSWEWSPLNYKEIKPVNPKGNQPWIFIERSDAEAESPIVWPPDVKKWLIGKDLDAGKNWRQEEKGMTGRWDGCIASLTQWTWVLSTFQEMVKDREARHAAVHGVAKSQMRLVEPTPHKLYQLSGLFSRSMLWKLKGSVYLGFWLFFKILKDIAKQMHANLHSNQIKTEQHWFLL